MQTLSIQSEHDLSSLRDIVERIILPNATQDSEDERFPIEIFSELHKLGWLYCFLPKNLGGSDFSTLDLACMSRMIAYGSSGIFSSFTVNVLGLTPILLYGSDLLKVKVCRSFVDKFSLFSYCMTEPDTGSNIAHSKTKAKRTNGGYLISGQKCFITNANHSEHLTVFAGLDRGDGSNKQNLTAFYVPASSEGVIRGKAMKKLGQCDSNTGELFFDKVFVPTENRIGQEGEGLKIAFHCLQRSKTMIAAAGVGMCDRAFDLVTHYLKGRSIYQKPLLSLVPIQNKLADIKTKAEAAWLLTSKAANVWENGKQNQNFAILEASMAKMFSSNATVEFISEVLELFGGYGYSREFEIERLYRDCRVLEIYEGPTLVQLALISKELFPEMIKRAAYQEKDAA